MTYPPIGRRAENAKRPQQVLSTGFHRNRAGGAALVLLLLGVVLAAAGVAAWMWLGRASSAGPATPAAAPLARAEPPSGPSSAAGAGQRTPAEVEAPAHEHESDSASRVGTDLVEGGGPPPPDPARFRGEGVLRGRLVLPDDAQLNGPWTLTVGPSRWLVGSEDAASRSVEFAADVRSFRLEELPLAGYRVDVEVEGWTARAVDVLLERKADDVFVTVVLERNGTLEGSLFRSGGVPAEGIAVRLEPLDEGVRGGEGYQSTVTVSGAFRFEGVPEGNWRLTVGPPTSPLLEPRLLELTRDGVRLPPATLPPLSWFRLVVLDAAGMPIEGAQVSASGTPNGVSRGETDQYGVYVGRDAFPGRWTARVTHPDHGTLRKQFVVRLELPFEDTLTLSR